jgi:hypothetical protein
MAQGCCSWLEQHSKPVAAPVQVIVVPALSNGAIDVTAFAAAVRRCQRCIVVLTLGTTMTGEEGEERGTLPVSNA